MKNIIRIKSIFLILVIVSYIHSYKVRKVITLLCRIDINKKTFYLHPTILLITSKKSNMVNNII